VTYIKDKNKFIFQKIFDIKNVLFTFKTVGLNMKLNKIKAFRLKVQQGIIIGFRNSVNIKLLLVV
jgi:hypothetical protein